MKKLIIPTILIATLSGMTGCMTHSRVIAEGEKAETVAGFSQDDIDSVLQKAISGINKASKRYAKAGKRRIVNVKDVTNDTNSRGRDAGALAESLGQGLREGLMGYDGDDGAFIVFNEKMAANAAARGQSVPNPEFVLFGRLTQRNMRKDNGDVYQEFALNLQLVDTATSLEFWQKRIPLRKEVDKANSMN